MPPLHVRVPDVLRELAIPVHKSTLPIADRLFDPKGSLFLIFFRYQMTHRCALLLGALNLTAPVGALESMTLGIFRLRPACPSSAPSCINSHSCHTNGAPSPFIITAPAMTRMRQGRSLSAAKLGDVALSQPGMMDGS